MSDIDIIKQIEKELNIKLKKLKEIESLLRLLKIGFWIMNKNNPLTPFNKGK